MPAEGGDGGEEGAGEVEGAVHGLHCPCAASSEHPCWEVRSFRSQSPRSLTSGICNTLLAALQASAVCLLVAPLRCLGTRASETGREEGERGGEVARSESRRG
eukprot:763399-Hanusia_phi.AAC.2